jgi:hypothetical protein
MAKNIIQLDLEASTEFQNIFKSDVLGRYVRPARTPHYIFDTTQFGNVGTAVYAFSVENQNTTEVMHYIIYTTGILRIYDEQFVLQFTTNISAESVAGFPAAAIGSFSHAVVNGQLIINSEYLSAPIYGVVGGGVIPAVKVASINPDTAAVDLLPGGVAVFGDRIVYSYINQIFISDPGTEPRTIVAQNTISFGGKVLDMFQAGPNGLFYVFTTIGLYTLPADGLAGQQSYAGFITFSKDYEATQLHNAAYSKNTIFGLLDNGVWDVNNSVNIEFIKWRRGRGLSQTVGNFTDLRYGRIYTYENGFVCQIGTSILMIDIVNKYSSWINNTNDSNTSLVGVLKTRDGKSIFCATDAVWELIGNTGNLFDVDVDYNNATFFGTCATNILTPPAASPVIREVTVGLDNNGKQVQTYVRGTTTTNTTGNTIIGATADVSLWDTASLVYCEAKFRSSRNRIAVRGDNLDLELKVTGANARISSNVQIVLNGQGTDRPSI